MNIASRLRLSLLPREDSSLETFSQGERDR